MRKNVIYSLLAAVALPIIGVNAAEEQVPVTGVTIPMSSGDEEQWTGTAVDLTSGLAVATAGKISTTIGKLQPGKYLIYFSIKAHDAVLTITATGSIDGEVKTNTYAAKTDTFGANFTFELKDEQDLTLTLESDGAFGLGQATLKLVYDFEAAYDELNPKLVALENVFANYNYTDGYTDDKTELTAIRNIINGIKIHKTYQYYKDNRLYFGDNSNEINNRVDAIIATATQKQIDAIKAAANTTDGTLRASLAAAIAKVEAIELADDLDLTKDLGDRINAYKAGEVNKDGDVCAAEDAIEKTIDAYLTLASAALVKNVLPFTDANKQAAEDIATAIAKLEAHAADAAADDTAYDELAAADVTFTTELAAIDADMAKLEGNYADYSSLESEVTALKAEVNGFGAALKEKYETSAEGTLKTYKDSDPVGALTTKVNNLKTKIAAVISDAETQYETNLAALNAETTGLKDKLAAEYAKAETAGLDDAQKAAVKEQYESLLALIDNSKAAEGENPAVPATTASLLGHVEAAHAAFDKDYDVTTETSPNYSDIEGAITDFKTDNIDPFVAINTTLADLKKLVDNDESGNEGVKQLLEAAKNAVDALETETYTFADTEKGTYSYKPSNNEAAYNALADDSKAAEGDTPAVPATTASLKGLEEKLAGFDTVEGDASAFKTAFEGYISTFKTAITGYQTDATDANAAVDAVIKKYNTAQNDIAAVRTAVNNEEKAEDWLAWDKEENGTNYTERLAALDAAVDAEVAKLQAAIAGADDPFTVAKAATYDDSEFAAALDNYKANQHKDYLYYLNVLAQQEYTETLAAIEAEDGQIAVADAAYDKLKVYVTDDTTDPFSLDETKIGTSWKTGTDPVDKRVTTAKDELDAAKKVIADTKKATDLAKASTAEIEAATATLKAEAEKLVKEGDNNDITDNINSLTEELKALEANFAKNAEIYEAVKEYVKFQLTNVHQLNTANLDNEPTAISKAVYDGMTTWGKSDADVKSDIAAFFDAAAETGSLKTAFDAETLPTIWGDKSDAADAHTDAAETLYAAFAELKAEVDLWKSLSELAVTEEKAYAATKAAYDELDTKYSTAKTELDTKYATPDAATYYKAELAKVKDTDKTGFAAVETALGEEHTNLYSNKKDAEGKYNLELKKISTAEESRKGLITAEDTGFNAQIEKVLQDATANKAAYDEILANSEGEGLSKLEAALVTANADLKAKAGDDITSFQDCLTDIKDGTKNIAAAVEVAYKNGQAVAKKEALIGQISEQTEALAQLYKDAEENLTAYNTAKDTYLKNVQDALDAALLAIEDAATKNDKITVDAAALKTTVVSFYTNKLNGTGGIQEAIDALATDIDAYYKAATAKKMLDEGEGTDKSVKDRAADLTEQINGDTTAEEPASQDGVLKQAADNLEAYRLLQDLRQQLRLAYDNEKGGGAMPTIKSADHKLTIYEKVKGWLYIGTYNQWDKFKGTYQHDDKDFLSRENMNNGGQLEILIQEYFGKGEATAQNTEGKLKGQIQTYTQSVNDYLECWNKALPEYAAEQNAAKWKDIVSAYNEANDNYNEAVTTRNKFKKAATGDLAVVYTNTEVATDFSNFLFTVPAAIVNGKSTDVDNTDDAVAKAYKKLAEANKNNSVWDGKDADGNDALTVAQTLRDQITTKTEAFRKEAWNQLNTTWNDDLNVNVNNEITTAESDISTFEAYSKADDFKDVLALIAAVDGKLITDDAEKVKEENDKVFEQVADLYNKQQEATAELPLAQYKELVARDKSNVSARDLQKQIEDLNTTIATDKADWKKYESITDYAAANTEFEQAISDSYTAAGTKLATLKDDFEAYTKRQDVLDLLQKYLNPNEDGKTAYENIKEKYNAGVDLTDKVIAYNDSYTEAKEALEAAEGDINQAWVASAVYDGTDTYADALAELRVRFDNQAKPTPVAEATTAEKPTTDKATLDDIKTKVAAIVIAAIAAEKKQLTEVTANAKSDFSTLYDAKDDLVNDRITEIEGDTSKTIEEIAALIGMGDGQDEDLKALRAARDKVVSDYNDAIVDLETKIPAATKFAGEDELLELEAALAEVVEGLAEELNAEFDPVTTVQQLNGLFDAAPFSDKLAAIATNFADEAYNKVENEDFLVNAKFSDATEKELADELANIQNRISVVKKNVSDKSSNIALYVDAIKADIANIAADVEALDSRIATEITDYENGRKADVQKQVAAKGELDELITGTDGLEAYLTAAQGKVDALEHIDADTKANAFADVKTDIEQLKAAVNDLYLGEEATNGTDNYDINSDINENVTITKTGENKTVKATGITQIKTDIDNVVLSLQNAEADLANTEAYENVLAEVSPVEKKFKEVANLITETPLKSTTKVKFMQRLYGETAESATTLAAAGGIQKELMQLQKDVEDSKLAKTSVADSTAQKKEAAGILAELNTLEQDIKDNRKGNVYQPDAQEVATISDYQQILNYIIEFEPMPTIEADRLAKYRNGELKRADLTAEELKFVAADMNEDGRITVADAIQVANVILTGDPETNYSDLEEAARRVKAGNDEVLDATMVQTGANSHRIAISLSNVYNYTAFQIDLVLPQGMHVVGEELSEERANTQSLLSNSVEGGYRIIAATILNRAFIGNSGDVLYIDVETDDNFRGGSVSYQNIEFIEPNGTTHEFTIGGNTTGIMDRMANAYDAAKEKVYNLGGRMMDGLKKGINIVGGKKIVKK